jgi:hypothetical protein
MQNSGSLIGHLSLPCSNPNFPLFSPSQLYLIIKYRYKYIDIHQMYNVCKFVLVLYNLEIAVANIHNRIGSVMVIYILILSVVDGLELRSGQTTENICCFSAHASLRNKNKDLLALNQDNVSKWNNMSARELLFQ